MIANMQSNNSETQTFVAWLKDRGIKEEVLSTFGLTVSNHPDIGPALRIPISPDKRTAKYRRHPLDDRKPKYLYDKGAKVSLFGADQLLSISDGPVIITEGELDALVCWSNNIPAVSSTGGALSFQEEWKSAFLGHDVYICYDNDEAGAEGMVRTLGYLPDAKVMFVPPINGVKDISDFVSRGGDLHALMETAVHFKDITEVEADNRKRWAQYQQQPFHQKYIDKHREQRHRAQNQSGRGQTPRKYVKGDRVLRAKEYPMTKLVDLQKNKACCLWHTEKTPSLHYYEKTNSAYCFGGCGRTYDSIDAYMKVHNVGFTKAVDELNKLL